MALDTTLKRVVRKIKRTICFQVAVEGLIPGLCTVAGTYHAETFKMKLTFGTVIPIDKPSMHAVLIREMRRALADFNDSNFTLIISLAVETLDDLGDIRQKYAVGDGEIDLTKLLGRL